MKLAYLSGKAKKPQPSLGGALIRQRPIIAVGISGPAGSWILDGLLDTGSDDTIFPVSYSFSTLCFKEPITLPIYRQTGPFRELKYSD